MFSYATWVAYRSNEADNALIAKKLDEGGEMSPEQDGMTAKLPTVPHPRMPRDFEPDYAIQRYWSGAGLWRTWDCAYTRVEADNLLAYYKKRYGQRCEWRLAKFMYG
jgi:hypothetical protein